MLRPPMDAARMLALLALVAGSTAAAMPLLRADDRGPRVHGASGRGIVSLSLPSDEILLSLVEPDALLAVSSFATDPTVSNVVDRSRRVGHTLRGTAEQVLALEPSVVFASSVHAPAEEALLARAGVHIERVGFVEGFEGIEANIRSVARVVDRVERGEELVAAMRAAVADVERRVRGRDRPRVLLYQTGGYSAGRGTLFDQEVTLAGGINVASEAGIEGYASISVERAAALDPDLLLTLDYRADARSRDVLGVPGVIATPGIATLRAAREGRVAALPPRAMMATSQYAADGVRALAVAMHGEAFR